DIAVRRGDLVIATHGRSFWVLDDLSPLRQLDQKAASAAAWLFAPREAVRFHPAAFQGTPEPKDEPSGENPPLGAILDYALRSDSSSPVWIEILDAKGDVVRRFSSDERPKPPDLTRIQITPDWVAVAPPPSASAGAHRFVWDLHYTLPKELVTPSGFRNSGAWAPPGRYTVRLTAAGTTSTQALVVARDPRVSASDADLVREFDLVWEIEAERLRIAGGQRQADAIRKQLSAVRPRIRGAAVDEASSIEKRLLDV